MLVVVVICGKWTEHEVMKWKWRVKICTSEPLAIKETAIQKLLHWPILQFLDVFQYCYLFIWCPYITVDILQSTYFKYTKIKI